MNRLLIRSVVVGVISGLLVFGMPTQAHAGGFGHDAVIKFSKASTHVKKLKVCRDWANDNSGCAKGSPRKKLKKGQNSKKEFKWADADGVYLPKACSMSASAFGGLRRVNVPVGSRGRWVKLGGLAGGTWVVTLACHPSGFSGGGGNGGGGGGGW